MQDDSITVSLGFADLKVMGFRTEGNGLVVAVRYRCMVRTCPHCGGETSHVHQYYQQLKEHIPIWDAPIVLELRKRRFWCRHCRRAFMEPDEVCGWRRRSTRRFRRALADSCREMTVKAVARRAAVSEALVRRAFAEHAPGLIQNGSLSVGLVALDELYLGARVGCVTLLYAPSERRVLAVCPGRTRAGAEGLLMGLDEGSRVCAAVMDMSEVYRQAVRYACPGAIIIADKFHVLSRVLGSLGRVVSGLQSRATRSDALALRRRRLFAATTVQLSQAEVRERDRLLEVYPELKEAWLAVQAFRGIYAARDRSEAARRLDAWWKTILQSGPREFRGLAYMFEHWREEILNYHTYPATNAFAEGKNNRIKAIIRAGYGYRNLSNLTQRIMLANETQPAAREACSPHFLT
jgi:transposase